jgi:hypothetical protein
VCVLKRVCVVTDGQVTPGISILAVCDELNYTPRRQVPRDNFFAFSRLRSLPGGRLSNLEFAVIGLQEFERNLAVESGVGPFAVSTRMFSNLSPEFQGASNLPSEIVWDFGVAGNSFNCAVRRTRRQGM